MNRGASPPDESWQLMHATPGCIEPDPLLPPVHDLPLVQVGAIENGSGGGIPASGPFVVVTVEQPVVG